MLRYCSGEYQIMSMDHPNSGVHFVPAYQIGGIPYVTSSDCTNTAVRSVQFPMVTRHFTVSNRESSTPLQVAFTLNGLKTEFGNMFYVPGNTVLGPLEIRTNSLFIASTSTARHNFSVIAGLTTVDAGEWPVTGSNGFPGVG